ncbi:MAG: NPCBM/NEW2 domain-containing protein [Planctomycetes bacterium]|nr:NPCBM/NEW2 domain-containing protein [Planctomycetota bacterium]
MGSTVIFFVACGLAAGSAPRPQLLLLDGSARDLPAGPAIEDGMLRADGADPIPIARLQEIILRPEEPFDARLPHATFIGGARLAGLPLRAGARDVVFRALDAGEVTLPLRELRALRLVRRADEDPLFLEALADPPARDVVFVQRRGQLVRVEGLFRGIADDRLRIEFGGQERSVEIALVYGIVFGPAAGDPPPAPEIEAHVALTRAGTIKGELERLDSQDLRLRTAAGAIAIPLDRVAAIRFRSSRMVFLSDVEPIEARDVPFFDRVFPHRRDKSTTGGPIRLGGKVRPKGLGLHSRSTLRYRIDGGYATLSATAGIDDAARDGCALLRLIGDDRVLFEGVLRSGDPPLPVSVPLAGVRVLTVEVDFGPDGVDVGDHVDIADARLIKSAGGGAS